MLGGLPTEPAIPSQLHNWTSRISLTSCTFHILFSRERHSRLSSYAFASINEAGVIAFDDPTDGDRLQQLVTKAAGKVKVSVAVGGWTFSEGSTKDRLSVMIESSASRATFINSVKTFISTYKIDGIDIDFGKPTICPSSHSRLAEALP